MAPAEWSRIFDLFHAAREKSGGERIALLDTACGEDTPLRKAIEELLKEDEAADGFLSEPLFRSSDSHHGTPVIPGQRFGRYIIGELIGRGGMGEVWSARDTDLERFVAFKFLSSEALATLDTQQMSREAKSASALNHPGIVTIHEVVQSESTFAIVMELVEGGSLRELCGKPNPVSEVIAIGLQTAEALAAAHAGRIVHGDIKPENILLRRDRYVKLLDFGLARQVTTKTIPFGMSVALGTLRYMSPEQARGEPLTPASDVFSLGLVLYELAAGCHPFPAASPLDTAQAILVKQPRSLSSVNPSVPARLASLVEAMLAKDAAARPSAVQVTRKLNEWRRPGMSADPVLIWKWSLAVTMLVALCFAAWRWMQVRDAHRAVSFHQITTLVPENRATAAAISPNGKLAAYANVDGIFVRTIQNGETKALSTPRDYVVDQLAWCNDGSGLGAGGFSTLTNIPSIWFIPGTGAAPLLFRTHARDITPSPDGTHLAFIDQDRLGIWVTAANGGQPRKIVVGSAGDRFPFVLWSPDGRRLAFERIRLSPGHERRHGELYGDHVWTYESVDLETGRSLAKIPGEPMSSATALPDGRILFLKWDTDFNSARQLWEVRTNATTGAFVGSPRKVATLLADKNETLIGLSATRDGKRMLVLRRSGQISVFIGDFDRSLPRITNTRRLTLDERTSYPHAWTADSRAVIFESDRNGNFDLFKQYIDQPIPETIVASPATEMLPQLAPNGRTVLYAVRPDDTRAWVYKLMRVPLDGGTPAPVPVGGPLDEFRCALDTGERCVVRTTIPGDYYAYYDLDPVRGKGRELARTKWIPSILGDWDISPDGTHIALPNHDSRDAWIRVLALDPSPQEQKERRIILKGLTDLRGLVWAAGGNGWFVSVDTTIGNRLLYVYPDGSFHPLGDISGWAVPSPDGRHVAFVNAITATNAWLVERH